MRGHSQALIPPDEKILFFRRKILLWFKKNCRIYPWRETKNPYYILIAEMMLRRTKANQVKPVYEQFICEFPDPQALAYGDNRKIKKLLLPLGLKWRTAAFRLLARELVEKYSCKVPERREDLKKLPGVGEYVAGAVMSIGFGKREWIVDSNIVRLFKRYFGVRTSKEGRRDKHVIEIARKYISCKKPREANLALLDFASLVCLSRKPLCETCLLSNNCYYRRKN